MHERLRAGPGVFGTAASPELSICATSHADTAIEKGSEAAAAAAAAVVLTPLVGPAVMPRLILNSACSAPASQIDQASPPSSFSHHPPIPDLSIALPRRRSPPIRHPLCQRSSRAASLLVFHSNHPLRHCCTATLFPGPIRHFYTTNDHLDFWKPQLLNGRNTKPLHPQRPLARMDLPRH